MEGAQIENIIEKFSELTAKPLKYLSVQDEIKDDVKGLIKSLYDFTKSQETKSKSKNKTLNELIIEDFDEEQIWQQIDLQNNECWDQLVWDVANSLSNTNDLVFPIDTNETKKKRNKRAKRKMKENNRSEPVITNPEVTEVNKSERESRYKKDAKSVKLTQGKTVKSSIVDDQFFKLNEMEQFLINEEKMEGKVRKKDEDEESIDLFEDIDDGDDDDDDGGNEVMYKDFFNDNDDEQISENGEHDEDNDLNVYDNNENEHQLDGDSDDVIENDEDMEYETSETDNKNKDNVKKVRFADLQPDSGSDSDSEGSEVETPSKKGQEGTNEKKSEFELRQQRLKQQISKLEEKTLSEAPWQLKGEVDAKKRPQNSLLQEVLDFDLTSRPAPIITEQTTVTLEGLIQQRIKDKAWDDVVRKEKPIDDQLAFKKTEVLDHSKSKLSLAQVYEAEYLKQKQTSSGEVVEEEEPESHKEIRESMSKLFAQLDALCHYHYTPKAPQAEVKIVSNTPAISMEEVAPVATSDAALLAPEEVKKKQKGDLMSKEERTQTDKNRERRRKKKYQREKGNKETKVTDHRNTMRGVESNDKSLKTSKAFFQQLNDNATSLIKNKNVNNKKK